MKPDAERDREPDRAQHRQRRDGLHAEHEQRRGDADERRVQRAAGFGGVGDRSLEEQRVVQAEARRGGLRDEASIARQVRRMLADDRAHAFVSRFFFPWLQLDTLSNADPDRKFFPDYDVALLHRGDEVEAWVRAHGADLVLLDLMLPGKNGLDACKALRAMAPELPIIMVTARVEEIDRLLEQLRAIL